MLNKYIGSSEKKGLFMNLMKSLTMVLALIVAQLTPVMASEIREKASSSYIFVKEVRPDVFQILYCQQGASACMSLGSKTTYTMQELNSLSDTEYVKAGIFGAGAAAAVIAGAWLGMLGGGVIGFKYLSGAAAITSSVVTGGSAGMALTAKGITLVDQINPLKHYQTAKLVSKMGTSEVDYVNDIDSQALWLHSRLKTIR